MGKEFSYNITLLLIINFLVKPLFIFVVEAGVQNLTGAVAYGQYFVLFDFAFLFLFLNDAGIQNYNSKHLAQNREDAPTYFGQILAYKLLMSAVFILTTLAFAVPAGYTADYMGLLILIVLVFVFNSFFVLLRTSLSSLGHYKWDTFISALDKIILLVVVGYLVYRGQRGAGFDIVWYPGLQLLAGIVSCVVAATLLWKTGLRFRLQFSMQTIKSIWRQTLPFALILLFSAAYNRMDAVMLDLLLDDGAYQAGLYAAGYRFIDAGNMVGFLFASLLLPMFSHALAKGQPVTDLFQQSFKTLFVLGAVLSACCIFYAADIYRLIYVREFWSSYGLLVVLMAAFIPVSLSHCFGSLLIASNRLREINTIFLLGLVVNFTGNLFFIPTFKAEGAAMITLFTQVFLFAGMAIWSARLFRDLGVYSLLTRSFLIIGLCFIIFYFVGSLALPWMWGASLSIILFIALAYAFNWLPVFKLSGTFSRRKRNSS